MKLIHRLFNPALCLCLLLPTIATPGPGDRAVSYLPAAHVADRMLSHYVGMATGMQVTSLANPKQLGQAIVETRPTFFGGVPRIWEKIMAGLHDDQGRVTLPGFYDGVAEPSDAMKSQWAGLGFSEQAFLETRG